MNPTAPALPGNGAQSHAPRASELGRRLLTALVAVPPVAWLLWRGGIPAAALFSLASVLATAEFLKTGLGRLRSRDAAVLSSAALLPWLPSFAPASAGTLALLLVGVSSGATWAWHVVREDVDGAGRDAPVVTQALVFCALGPFFLASLSALDQGPRWVLTVVAATFLNDAAAYLGGRTFGRHHLAPRVSPGKTWEGALAGTLGSAATCALAAVAWPETFRPLDAAVLAVGCSVLGPLGDLSKSLLKRAHHVKDSGHLLPGHGGVLDRIDALLFNALAAWAWAWWAR